MAKYAVWYRKDPMFRLDKTLTVSKIPELYAPVRFLHADNLEDAFCKMQAENWSPNGEARLIIAALRLQHTSMSVGDIIKDELGVWWQVDSFDFVPVPEG